MESIERFGTEVLPEFAERDAAHVAERDRRYAPLIDAAFERKAGTTIEPPVMPDDYVMKAIPKAMVDQMNSPEARRFLDKVADEGAVGSAETLGSLLT
jgi:hypothetical protein